MPVRRRSGIRGADPARGHACRGVPGAARPAPRIVAIASPRLSVVRIIDEMSQQIRLRQNGFGPAGRAGPGGWGWAGRVYQA